METICIYIPIYVFGFCFCEKLSSFFFFFFFFFCYSRFCYSRKFRAFTMITVGCIPVADRWFLLVWRGPPIQSVEKKNWDSGVYLLGTMRLWPKTLTHALLIPRANEMRVGFGLCQNFKPTYKKKVGGLAVVIGECELRSKAVRASIIAFLIWSPVVR